MKKTFFLQLDKIMQQLLMIAAIVLTCNCVYGQQTLLQVGNTTTGNNVIPQGITVQGIVIGTGTGTTGPANYNSTAVGKLALERATTTNTSSNDNVAIGYLALRGNTNGDGTGPSNTATGINTGYNNTAVGSNSCVRIQNGQNNTGIGNGAIKWNTNGNFNSALGSASLFLCQNSSYNTAIGGSSLRNYNPADTSTGDNTSIGYKTLYNLLSGAFNSALGSGALYSLGSGVYNVGIGAGAQVQTSPGDYQLSIQNVIYGRDMQSGTTHGNVSIGTYPAPTTVVSTLPIGRYSKLKVAGFNTGTPSTSVPSLQLDYVPVWPNALPVQNPGTGTAMYLFIDRAGVISQAPLPTTTTGINSTCSGVANIGFIPRNNDAAGNLRCSQITDDGNTVQIGTGLVGPLVYAGGGAIGALPGGAPTAIAGTTPLRLFVNGWMQATGYISTSDQRLKKDIKKIDYSLDKISKISGYTYNWNKEYKTERQLDDNRQAGFLAQEIEKILPEAVVINSDGIYGLNYNAIMPLLTEGIKEQQSQIETQDLKIQNLELQITELRNKLNQLSPGNIKINVNSLEVVPNPITGTSIVSYKIDNANAASFLIIADLQGKLLKQIGLPKNAKEGQVQVGKKDLPNGLYIFSLLSGNTEIQSKKVLVAE